MAVGRRDHPHLMAPATNDAATAPIKRFLIRYGDHLRVVEPDDIAYVHSIGEEHLPAHPRRP